jgi:hypothetical protein
MTKHELSEKACKSGTDAKPASPRVKWTSAQLQPEFQIKNSIARMHHCSFEQERICPEVVQALHAGKSLSEDSLYAPSSKIGEAAVRIRE